MVANHVKLGLGATSWHFEYCHTVSFSYLFVFIMPSINPSWHYVYDLANWIGKKKIIVGHHVLLMEFYDLVASFFLFVSVGTTIDWQPWLERAGSSWIIRMLSDNTQLMTEMIGQLQFESTLPERFLTPSSSCHLWSPIICATEKITGYDILH